MAMLNNQMVGDHPPLIHREMAMDNSSCLDDSGSLFFHHFLYIFQSPGLNVASSKNVYVFKYHIKKTSKIPWKQ